MSQTSTLAPVTLSLELKCSAAHAFKVFTAEVAKWWPLDSHSVELEKAKGVVFEAKVGGRIYEIGADGTEHLWGTVLDCRASDYLKYTWHPGGDPKDVHTEVEVTFVETGKTSRLDLVHTGFERYGERAGLIRENYITGWQYVAGECFKAAVEG